MAGDTAADRAVARSSVYFAAETCDLIRSAHDAFERQFRQESSPVADRTSRIILAITGASGAIYGIRALELLSRVAGLETHLLLSPAAGRTITEETDWTVPQLRELATVVHNYRDIGATIASGSFRTLGMLIAPCSVRTLSAVVNCISDNLIARAADVCLKERRRVVLMLRETPLHLGHIELMAGATRMGAIVMPPVPGFYSRPRSLDDIVDQSVGRALDLFDIDLGIVKRWTGEAPPVPAPLVADSDVD
jgi:4-hydroxy-3-polyprenylbenzoate decarboxylase